MFLVSTFFIFCPINFLRSPENCSALYRFLGWDNILHQLLELVFHHPMTRSFLINLCIFFLFGVLAYAILSIALKLFAVIICLIFFFSCFDLTSRIWQIIASAGLDMKLYTFDSGSRKPASCIPYEAPFSSLAFTDDGLTLAAGTSTGQVVFYDVRGKPQPITVLRAYGSSEVFLIL